MAGLVEDWSDEDEQGHDPFGCVLWPGAAALAELLLATPQLAQGRAAVELGAGTGLCSFAAALSGASTVTATDANPLPLELLSEAAEAQRLKVATQVFDICGEEPLPASMELLIAADVCYNPRVARALARRCDEARRAEAHFVVTDSVDLSRGEFLEELVRLEVPHTIRTVERTFTGHAVALDEDLERTCKVLIVELAQEGERTRRSD